jgi:hypothetical protein
MVQQSAQPGASPRGRCKHGLLVSQCGRCNPAPSTVRSGRHLSATAILRCRECRSELVREDANRTSLITLLMRARRQHSEQVHASLVETLSSADVVLLCNVCGREFDVLDVNTASLGNEIMACRSDHEKAAH